ncbi:MAG: gliding motility lipoprotein GldH [Crocinitomicaceae bacterium]|nr:gliding motility lipoprotein GldH [Crocinitomicaceae bacterium]
MKASHHTAEKLNQIFSFSIEKMTALLIVSMLFFLASCDHNVVFEKNEKIEKGVWKAANPFTMEFDVSDTVRLHNFYINLRNGEEYPFSNIFLFVAMEFPNGKKSVDTLECPLADPTGRWYGSGLGDLYDSRILFKERKQFPLAGHYKVEIAQAMRTEELKGIYDIGFRVTSSQ